MKQGFHHQREIKSVRSLALDLVAVASIFCSGNYVFAADTNVSASSLPPTVKALISKNCATCHRPPNPPLGIDLTALTFNLSDVDTFGRWVRIHDAVRDGKMPPGAPSLLTETDRTAFVKAVAEPLSAYEHLRARTEGRAVLRRLNRYEYESSIRELLSAPWLQLKDSLPEDGLDHRLNKSGEALDVSHVQMSRYMDAAERAIRLVANTANQTEVQKRYYARDQKR